MVRVFRILGSVKLLTDLFVEERPAASSKAKLNTNMTVPAVFKMLEPFLTPTVVKHVGATFAFTLSGMLLG